MLLYDQATIYYNIDNMSHKRLDPSPLVSLIYQVVVVVVVVVVDSSRVQPTEDEGSLSVSFLHSWKLEPRLFLKEIGYRTI